MLSSPKGLGTSQHIRRPPPQTRSITSVSTFNVQRSTFNIQLQDVSLVDSQSIFSVQPRQPLTTLCLVASVRQFNCTENSEQKPGSFFHAGFICFPTSSVCAANILELSTGVRGNPCTTISKKTTPRRLLDSERRTDRGELSCCSTYTTLSTTLLSGNIRYMPN
ncbi:uncharacterized protein LAESUDRAFT_236897 [Laetiporus sulphureus 93-53]|uniref:Uncharacterized protein n=1 Tax=Laetiporus sulphureus 93-53 TaxID=1314785 RepID=A0A165DNF4_9APHY|nr:uncharacterized protein LAESUDRAFT_236897 [Laetiporus sulphureus 93-53]KZT05265.1 hypothetical protein LAESUDRAFT_236897 [Laetiporus sulphureus 93-53]